MSGCQWTPRLLVLGSLVILSFLVLFFTYYNPDTKFYSLEHGERVAPPSPVPVCASNVEPNHGSATILLLWSWPLGFKFDLSCGAFDITGCRLTDDRARYSEAHGVLFHHGDIRGDLAGMPTEPRPLFQKWVWSNMESPSNSARIPALDRLFNLTCSYRLGSSIPVPYGRLEPLTPEDGSFQLPAKDKLVCWIVSHWNPRHERVQFYNELKKHVGIHAYGRAFGQHLSDQDYSKIVSSCKFYLSFENSIHEDYITEKLFIPMLLGSVPIVLGPSREDYEDHVPGDSFLHVSDFPSAEKLAERLLDLDRSDSDYMRYFNWKKWFQVKRSVFGKEHACRTCSYLQKHRGYEAFHGLNKWYWG